jgi:Anti-sigma-K factor rskA, C-terminal
VNRVPRLDDLIGDETTGAERERLQHVHDLLLQAGPPPELTPELEAGPTLGMTLSRRRRATKPRAMLLLAAALAIFVVFIAGYAVANGRSGKSTSGPTPLKVLALQGTSIAPGAQATLQLWHSSAGNYPMTLRVDGLPQLPSRTYYEVYLVRNGKPWGSCGTFRVQSRSGGVTVTLTAPYSLRKGDSWVVTRPGPGGAEPGQTVLRPVTA